jgi:hypothetical protein
MEKTPAAMAQQAISLLRDSDRFSNSGRRHALEFSRQFSWDDTVNLFEKVLNNQIKTNADPITN